MLAREDGGIEYGGFPVNYSVFVIMLHSNIFWPKGESSRPELPIVLWGNACVIEVSESQARSVTSGATRETVRGFRSSQRASAIGLPGRKPRDERWLHASRQSNAPSRPHRLARQRGS